MSDFRYLGTPEAVLTVAGDLPPGYPIDAMECALSRADALLVLLSGQFDGTGAERLADHIICNALWSVRGELDNLGKLLGHGYATEEQRVAADLDRALAAAGKASAKRKGGAE